MTSRPDKPGAGNSASERSNVLRSRDSVVESVVRLLSSDTESAVVGGEYHQLRKLEQALRNQKGGFGLLFAVCNDISRRRHLIQQIRKDLPDQHPVEVQLQGDEESLLEKLLRAPGAPEPLFVYGLENLLPSADEEASRLRREATLHELQLSRERFRKLARPLLLWLPEYAYTMIGQQAIDFWSWQGGAAFFTKFQEEKVGIKGDLSENVIVTGDRTITGQRNVAVKGNVDNSVIVTGDHATIYQTSPPIISAKHQLPSPPRDFTGRAQKLSELLAALDRGAILSVLQGLGGVGKTALALKLAEQIKDRYPDAQFYLDLRGVSDKPLTPAEAMAHVIRAYRPMDRLPESEAGLQPLYLSTLYNQHALLLMDNARDDAQVRPLIPPANCLLLVTSRRHFTLPEIKAHRLGELRPEDAIALLHKIAPRIRDWEGCDAEIAAACGHLPLALRAAGSLLEVTLDLRPADYARQLRDERTRLETIGAEGVDHGVEASFNLSYERLAPEAARVFRQLSVFAGSFDAAAGETVCEDAGHKRLSELVRLSLVEYDDRERRYRLHDLVRLFANARMSEDERDAAGRRHAEYFCLVLRRAGDLYEQGGEAVARGLAFYDLERANIEAGQDWAKLHAEQDERAAEICIEYPSVAVDVLLLRQHPREWIYWLEIALAAARKLKRRSSEGIVLGNLGIAYKILGQVHKSIEFYEQSLIIAREFGDRQGEGMALGNLGLVYAILGETRKAIEFYKQALAILRKIDRRGEGAVLGNLGTAYRHLDETRKAIEFYEQQLGITREIGDRRGEGNALGNLGNAYTVLGETRKSIEFYEQRLAIAREIGDRQGEGIALFNLSEALDKLGDRAQAITHAEAALRVFEEIESLYREEVRKKLAEWYGQA